MNSIIKYNKSITIVLTTAIIYAVFLFGQLYKANWNFSQFIYAGNYFVSNSEMPKSFITHNNLGYDGEFYYRFSLNPFSYKLKDYGILLDSPAYRQQRIMYPFIAWVFTYGNPNLLPIELVLLNFLGICLLAYIGTKFCKYFHKPIFLGMIFPFYAGFLFTLSFDLTEIFEITFLLAGLLFFLKKNYWQSSLFLSLAVITKETAIITPLVILLFWLKDKILKVKSRNWQPAIIPISVFILYHVWLFYRWGPLWRSEINNNIGIPFDGIYSFILSIFPSSNHFQYINLYAVCFILILQGLFLYSNFRKKGCFNLLGLLWSFYFILAFSLKTHVWVEDRAYLRAISDGIMIGFLLLLQSKSKLIYPAFILTSLTWLIYFIELFQYRGFN